MASWMIHLRIAQGIYTKLQLEHRTEFIMGNIAPDSGVPAVDGTGFVPDTEVSHFRIVDENGRKAVHDDLFVAQYFTKEKRIRCSEKAYAFYLGYWVHLLTDKLWSRMIVQGAKERYSDLYQQDATAFWEKIKGDWYDLDFLYLKKYPEFEAFRIYEGIKEFKNSYLDFFAEDAFIRKKEVIIEFYRKGVEALAERETYISPEELDTFVEYAVNEIIETVNKEICV